MHAIPARAAGLALLFSMTASGARAADVTSTRLSGLPLEWTDIGRWSHDQDVSTFPNNGNENKTFDVIFPGNLVTMDQDITIDSLRIFGTLELSGNTLTLADELDAQLAELRAGTLVTDELRISSTNLTLQDVQATTQRLIVNTNGSVVLEGSTLLHVTESVVFTGDGDLNNFGDVEPAFDLSNVILSKTGGTSATDVRGRVLASSLSIHNTSPTSSVFRFLETPQTWSNLGMDSTGAAHVELAMPLTVETIDVDLIAGGEVRIAGPTTLGATLNSSGTGTVRLTSFDDAASLSGGTLECLSSGPFEIASGGTLGATASVTNRERLHWTAGRIGAGGLINLGTLTTVEMSGAAPRTLAGGSISNLDRVEQFHPITFNADAMATNSHNWVLEDLLSSEPEGTLPTSLFRSTADLGTRSTPGGAVSIHVPFECSDSLKVRDSITTHASTTLGPITIDGNFTNSDDGQMVLTPNGAPPGATLQLLDSITLEASDPKFVLCIAGGDYVSNALITTPPFVGQARACLEGTGSLSGGMIDIGSNDRFFGQFDTSVIGKTSSVTNLRNYLMKGGEIGAGGLVNRGEVRFDPAGPPLRVANFINRAQDGALTAGNARHLSGVVSLLPPGVINESTWTAGRDTIINYVDAFLGGAFVNTGTFQALDTSSTVVVDVDVSNEGTVIADQATIDFTGFVTQFDAANRVLTGGTWTVRNNGRILLPGLAATVGADSSVSLEDVAPAGTDQWSDVERVQGMLALSGVTVLDVTGNDDFGDLDVDPGGDISDGDLVLGPIGSAPHLIANTITTRGRLNVFGSGVVNAHDALNVSDGGRVTGHLGVIETPIVSNDSGVVAPGFDDDQAALGAPVGALTIDGTYDQHTGGTLAIQIAGPGAADRLDISGSATLGGDLVIDALNDFTPAPNDSFDVLIASSVSGTFDSITAPAAFDVTYLVDRVRVTFTGPACAGDVDGSGGVEFADLLTVLSAWGACAACPADLTGDGFVDFSDLLEVLANWGPCP